MMQRCLSARWWPLVLGMAVTGSLALSGATGGNAADVPRTDEKTRSAALFVRMGAVLQSPRCLNCHPRGDSPTQGEVMRPHDPPVWRGADGNGVAGMHCSTCHGPRNVAFAAGGSIPGSPRWHLAPPSMAWRGLTLRQICRQLKDRERNGGKSLDDLIAHNRDDELVGWGWRPGPGRVAAPGTQAEFGALTEAWVRSGAHCP